MVSLLISIGLFLLFAAPLVIVVIRRKKIKRINVVGPLMFLVFLCGIEISLRAGPLKYSFLKNNVGKNFAPHTYLFWLPKDSPTHFTPLDKIEINKLKGVVRVVTMGGSNVIGSRIDNYSKTLTGQLEWMTKKRFPECNFEFISAGQPGFVLFQNLVLYKLYIRQMSPDLIVLYCNVNDRDQPTGPYTYRELFKMRSGVDVSDLWITENTFPKKTSLLWKIQDGAQAFRTYGWLRKNILDVREKWAKGTKETSVVKEMNSAADYQKNLEDLISIIKKDGTRIILVDAVQYKELQNPSDREKTIRQLMKATAEKEGVPFISAHEILHKKHDQDRMFFSFDHGHINEFGHAVVSNLIFKVIEKEQSVMLCEGAN